MAVFFADSRLWPGGNEKRRAEKGCFGMEVKKVLGKGEAFGLWKR